MLLIDKIELMFRSIAKFSVKFRWPIIVFWIAMVPILSSAFPKIGDVTQNSTKDFLPKNSPTDQASKLESAFQKQDTASNAVIVVSKKTGTFTDQDNVALQQMVAKVKAVKEVTEVDDQGASADGQAHEYMVGISGAAFGNGAVTIVANLRSTLHKSGLPSDVKANLTGDLAAEVDQENSNNSGKD